MSSNNRKYQILASVAALVVAAMLVSCTGFFQNPTLTTLTVGPNNVNLQQGTTIQMQAFGTYNDGTQKTLTNNLFWSSSDSTVASVSTAGIVSGVASGGPVTITAQSGPISGTSTVTVTLANVTAINITPTSQSAAANGGTTTYQCFAQVAGMSTPVDVSNLVTWSSTDVNLTFTQGTSPVTVMVGASTVGTVDTITATYTSGSTTLTATAKLNIT